MRFSWVRLIVEDDYTAWFYGTPVDLTKELGIIPLLLFVKNNLQRNMEGGGALVDDRMW